MNSKAAVQSGFGAPTALSCTLGKDFYINLSTGALYYCTATGSPGTWQAPAATIAGTQANNSGWNWAINNQGELLNFWLDSSQGTPFPASGFIQAPDVHYDGAVFSQAVPSNAHIGYGIGAALAAYEIDYNTAIAGVGLYAQALTGVNNAPYSAGINTMVSDANCKAYSPSTCTSYASASLVNEFDFTVSNSGTGFVGLSIPRPWSTQTEQNGFAWYAWTGSAPYEGSLGSKSFSCSGCTPGAADVLSELTLPLAWGGLPVTGSAGLDTRQQLCVTVASTGTPDTYNVFLDPWTGAYCAGATATAGPLNFTTTKQFVAVSGALSTLALSFAHTTGHNAADTWSWPATGNTVWPYGGGLFDGCCTVGLLIGSQLAGLEASNSSLPLQFHSLDASGVSHLNDFYYDYQAGFTFLNGSGATVLNVSTTNTRVGIGPIASPSVTLDVEDPAVLGTESITNGSNLAGTGWTLAGNCSTSGANAACTGAGTISQTTANLAIRVAGTRMYRLIYTISSPSGSPSAYITTSVGAVNVPLSMTAGTYTVYFLSAVAPTNFVINVPAGTFTIGTLSLKQVLGGAIQAGSSVTARAFVGSGSLPGMSGCSATTQTGENTIGTYTSGTSGTCAVTLTFSTTAPIGWNCSAWDRTTPADLQGETTGGSATTAIISGTTVTGDVVQFACFAY